MFVDAVLGNLLVFVVGQAFAWLYLRSATLWQPIIFHTIFNLVSFVQFAGHR